MTRAAKTQPAAPRGNKRRRFRPVMQQGNVILDAAGALFLDQGYEGVSIDAITAIVGGSKRDLYGLFGNKEALFRAVIAHLAKARVALFRNLSMEGELRSALTMLGIAVLRILLAPETLALHRLIVAEAPRVPESAATFLESGPLAAHKAVEDLLRSYASGNQAEMPDPAAAAVLFVDALAGGLLLRALLGQAVTDDDIVLKSEFVVTHLFGGALTCTAGRTERQGAGAEAR